MLSLTVLKAGEWASRCHRVPAWQRQLWQQRSQASRGIGPVQSGQGRTSGSGCAFRRWL